ncbi:hypothetical protein [Stigmatella aurantiaca]|uniref:Uncharacterized protein n=1 Tax=Stigmatella aurantiaca (strain DW4/3-1) TaxID=378806 RepID=E3FN74_STIAD|nr:hypothetical protein [Stigmatella aurantiaca]ADO74362.1 uncharacterized protein STAUR_6605 [Stigmatella aurantiaca DW4/3-1]
MRTLPLLLLVLLAGPAAAQKSGAAIRCQEDHTACKEDCTVEYGSSSRTYNKLGACLRKCETTFGTCKERHFSLQQHNFDPATGASSPPSDEPTARTAPRTVSDDSSEALAEDASPARRQDALKGPTPSSTSTPPSEEAPVVERRGVYRASEAHKPSAPAEEPAETPAPVEEEAVAPAPPPPPAPKPAPQRSSVPKEPKKKDISDWDPTEK